MLSALSWKNVPVWRKSWAYITVIRHIRGKGTYNKWHDFLWEDYQERNSLHMTFVKRHLPLSNGSAAHFRGELTDPPSWKITITKTVRYKKIKTENPVVVNSLPASSVAVMGFDKQTGELTEFVDLTE